jgi:hypothetical protein
LNLPSTNTTRECEGIRRVDATVCRTRAPRSANPARARLRARGTSLSSIRHRSTHQELLTASESTRGLIDVTGRDLRRGRSPREASLPQGISPSAQLIRPTGHRQRLDQDRFAARTADNPRIASNLALTYKCQKPITAALSSVIGFPEMATNTADTVDH